VEGPVALVSGPVRLDGRAGPAQVLGFVADAEEPVEATEDVPPSGQVLLLKQDSGAEIFG
jgi:hypothetical protein